MERTGRRGRDLARGNALSAAYALANDAWEFIIRGLSSRIEHAVASLQETAAAGENAGTARNLDDTFRTMSELAEPASSVTLQGGKVPKLPLMNSS